MININKTSHERVEEYFKSEALNQSRLKLLLSGMMFFKNSSKESELYFVEKESLIIGSAVDCLITESKEEFDKRFYVSILVNKPTDVVKSIINNVYDTVKNHGVSVEDVGSIKKYSAFIVDSCIRHNYYPNLKVETRVAKIVEFSEYWETLKLSDGKIVLSLEQISLIREIKDNLLSNPIISELLTTKENEEIYFQVPLFFMYKGVQCKALLDVVKVYKDSEGEVIKISPIDLKTSAENTINFIKPLRRFRYDLQAAWYTEAIKSNLDIFGAQEDVEVENFKFIVESTTTPGSPLVYKCSNSLLEIGKFGRKALTGNGILVKEPIKGFDQLVDDYIYYEKQGWLEDKRIEEGNGVLELDFEGIIEKNNED